MVQWTPTLAPQVWTSFTNIITYPGPPPPITNGIGQFRFLDDGSQFPFGPMRFYRVLLLGQGLNSGGTNTLAPGGIDFFQINVPTNAFFATNLLLFANGPLNIWYDTNTPPATNVFLFSGTSGSDTLSTTGGSPTNLVPGSSYWLGVQNTNTFAVNFGLEVDFGLTNVPAPPTGPVTIFSITATNISGKFGFLLQWLAPTNDVFQVQWTGSLTPPNWQFFTNFVYYGGPPVTTNGVFAFFDDGSQTGGFGPFRSYRVLLVGSVPSTHTNTVLLSSITLTNISGLNNFLLQWSAPTNYWFEVQWATNLSPVITWQTFPNVISYSTLVSPTNSLFQFLDNGSSGGLGPLKFYRLLLLP